MKRTKIEKRNSKLGLAVCCLLISIFYFLPLWAQAPTTADRPVVASYYKIAPGKTDEWLARYRAQHLPILKELQREGRILSITLYKPFLHQGGPEWDFQVTLVWRDFAAMGDRAHEAAVERRLFSDWEAHRRDEQRRWEITARHWDDLMTELPSE